MDLVHDRGSMDLVHKRTRSKVGSTVPWSMFYPHQYTAWEYTYIVIVLTT